MTVAAATPINSYIGSGSASAFPFTFPVFASNQVAVTVVKTSVTPNVTTTLIEGTDYNVSGLNAAGTPATTGTVTLINAAQAWLTTGNLSTGYTITIQAGFALSQPSSIRNQGDFDRAFLEDALDNLEYQIQQLNLLALTLNGGGTVTVNTNIINIVGVSSTGASLATGKTYLVHTLLGAFTVNLPTPASGTWFFIKDADQNAWNNNITVHRAASEKIDGIAADLVLQASNGSWMICSDGTNWFSIAMGGDVLLNDTTNGHTYRLIMQNGVVGGELVT